jgi:hypothetical protein
VLAETQSWFLESDDTNYFITNGVTGNRRRSADIRRNRTSPCTLVAARIGE